MNRVFIYVILVYGILNIIQVGGLNSELNVTFVGVGVVGWFGFNITWLMSD